MDGQAVVDYQELLLGLSESQTVQQETELSTIHVPLTIPENVDVRQLRHDEEIHRTLYSIKLAALVVAQCLYVEDHEPIPELFYMTETSTTNRDVFNTRDPSVIWHV